MANEFDPNDAVTQESLEPQQEQPQYSIKVQGFEEETQLQTGLQDDTVVEEPQVEDTPAIEVVTPQPSEEVQQPEVEDEVELIGTEDEVPTSQPVEEVKKPGDLPEWVEKLVEFTKDTGGGLEDYLQYTKDFDSLNDDQVLKEFYRATKPQYSDADIDLLLEEKYTTDDYDEDEEMSREDRLRMLDKKDELFKAKHFLNENKSKYYADLKSGVHGAPEQYREAVEFHNQAREQHEATEAWRDRFVNQSKQVFHEGFKGFTFEGGETKYRINSGSSPEQLLDVQVDLQKIVGEFLGEDGNVADIQGYHKAIWAAKNADKIFKVAFEQGKAVALKERATATKNPNYKPDVGSGHAAATSSSKFKFLGSKH